MPVVPFNRLLKYINRLIAIVLVAALVVVYWYGYRPLPKTSGTIETHVSQNVTVTRDAQGTPHIAAGSLDDVLFAQGYVTAQDRLWQMDSLRRLAGGELAEIVGRPGRTPGRSPAGSPDRASRSWRMTCISSSQCRGSGIWRIFSPPA